MDFRTTTLRELHEKLVSGEVTPGDLLDHSKSVIEDRNPTVNAFIEVFDGQDTNIDPYLPASLRRYPGGLFSSF